jgi:adenosylhomocysteinase
MYKQGFAKLPAEQKKRLLRVEVLPKKLDEEVAALMVQGFGGVVTKLTSSQAKYINVKVEGPFKPDSYKY